MRSGAGAELYSLQDDRVFGATGARFDIFEAAENHMFDAGRHGRIGQLLAEGKLIIRRWHLDDGRRH